MEITGTREYILVELTPFTSPCDSEQTNSDRRSAEYNSARRYSLTYARPGHVCLSPTQPLPFT